MVFNQLASWLFSTSKLIQEHASTASKMRLERSFVFVRTIVRTQIFRRRCSPGRFGCLGVRPARRLRNFTVRRILKIPKFVARAKSLESNSTRRKRFLSEARPRRREIPYRRKKKDARAERRKNDDDDRARAPFL